jgi:hypothetical protein
MKGLRFDACEYGVGGGSANGLRASAVVVNEGGGKNELVDGGRDEAGGGGGPGYGSLPNASWIEGNDSFAGGLETASSADVRREPGGDMSPDALAVAG